MTTTNARPALLLNADFQPISFYPLSLLGWQDAVRAVLSERVVVVEEYEDTIRSSGSEHRAAITMNLPSVVALRDYQRQDRTVAFTRIGLLVRDRFRCCYCGERFAPKDLTFEHIIPRSKGGKTRWDNICAACGPCNLRRGNRPLAQCGMTLLQKPFVPTRYQLNERGREFPPPLERLHPTWLAYLGIDPGSATPARVTEGPSSEAVFPAAMTDADYWNVELEAD